MAGFISYVVASHELKVTILIIKKCVNVNIFMCINKSFINPVKRDNEPFVNPVRREVKIMICIKYTVWV